VKNESKRRRAKARARAVQKKEKGLILYLKKFDPDELRRWVRVKEKEGVWGKTTKKGLDNIATPHKGNSEKKERNSKKNATRGVQAVPKAHSKNEYRIGPV